MNKKQNDARCSMGFEDHHFFPYDLSGNQKICLKCFGVYEQGGEFVKFAKALI